MSEKIVLIDGHSIINRAFYGVPDLTNSDGLHTNAIYGFLNIMFRILDEEKPDYLVVAFDLKAPTFRHLMYDAYKGTRKPMPEELREQVPVLKEVLQAMGIPLLMKEGFEADDLLGTAARVSEEKGINAVIVSGDRDLLQLATDNVLIRMPKTPLDLSNIISYMFLVEEPNEYVYKFKASAIHFTSEESVDWVLDGEYGGARTEVTIENLRERIPFLLPYKM